MNILSNAIESCVPKIIYSPLYPKILNRTLAYKSAISLENLYPNSSLKLSTPSAPPQDAKSGFNGYIPIDELDITYSKSAGPGGQNVNKVNTKVDVRFHLQSAKWLSDEIKNKLTDKLQAKINKEGYVIYRSDLTRSQQLNLADCLEKIRANIRECLVEKMEPNPETLERIRRRLERTARERLLLKRERSQVKSTRQTPDNVFV